MSIILSSGTFWQYKRKTQDMSWHGGYEFILLFKINVMWKSFWHPFPPFLPVGLVKNSLMQSDQALKSLKVFINNIGWASKVGCPQKVAWTGKYVFWCLSHHGVCRLSTEMVLACIFRDYLHHWLFLLLLKSKTMAKKRLIVQSFYFWSSKKLPQRNTNNCPGKPLLRNPTRRPYHGQKGTTRILFSGGCKESNKR